MKFKRTYISDIILCIPEIFKDNRGYFTETFRQDEFERFLNKKVDFCQDNEAGSVKGVVRGLHYQLPPYEQAKLVRVIKGKVLDIAVDIRKNSPTYGRHVAVELDDENKCQLFIPKGFAHGYIALSEHVILAYKVDTYYKAAYDRGIKYNDPSLKIDWKLPESAHKVSEKDQKQPLFENIEAHNSKGKS